MVYRVELIAELFRASRKWELIDIDIKYSIMTSISKFRLIRELFYPPTVVNTQQVPFF